MLASKRGEPRVGVTQAAFQIAEWKDFINHHYQTLRDRFPGISSSPQSMVVIGRASPLLQGAADAPRYLALLREQLAVDEVITYDDLLERARMVYVQIAGLEMSPTD